MRVGDRGRIEYADAEYLEAVDTHLSRVFDPSCNMSWHTVCLVCRRHLRPKLDLGSRFPSLEPIVGARIPV